MLTVPNATARLSLAKASSHPFAKAHSRPNPLLKQLAHSLLNSLSTTGQAILDISYGIVSFIKYQVSLSNKFKVSLASNPLNLRFLIVFVYVSEDGK